jgi:hypothetical protein
MSITNYTELKAAIADFLNRDDLTSAVPTFITLAESNIQRRIRHWRQEARSTVTIDAQYEDLPADFLEAIRFYVTSDNTNPLELISQAELLDRKQLARDTSGRPRFYAITSGQFELYPVPDGSYDAEIYYFSRIPALSDAAPTNWLLEYFPDVLLYGALVHSAPYLKEDARIQIWSALYQEAVDSINTSSQQAKFGGSGQRLKIRSY